MYNKKLTAIAAILIIVLLPLHLIPNLLRLLSLILMHLGNLVIFISEKVGNLGNYTIKPTSKVFSYIMGKCGHKKLMDKYNREQLEKSARRKRGMAKVIRK